MSELELLVCSWSTAIRGTQRTRLMTKLFFHVGDMHAEVRHLEKANLKGMSRSDLHDCAKTAISRQFKATMPSMDEKKATCDRLVNRALAIAAIPDFASAFSNVVEKHANAWRNNEATSVLCESLHLWMKHCNCPIHRSILIQIELDTGANCKLLMNNGNTRLFTTASNWLIKGCDFSLDIHAFRPLISHKTK